MISVITESANAVYAFIKNLGIAGVTQHLSYDDKSKVAHILVDDVVTGVYAQLRSEAEKKTLAAYSISILQDFLNSYQLGVQNLSAIRSTISRDNWIEAIGQKDGAGYTLQMIIDKVSPQMYAMSVWRCAMFVLDNISTDPNDATLPARIQTVYDWHAELIARFSREQSVLLGSRVISPIAQKGTSAPVVSPTGIVLSSTQSVQSGVVTQYSATGEAPAGGVVTKAGMSIVGAVLVLGAFVYLIAKGK